MEPIFLKPIFAERVWGGTRLKALFGKAVPQDKVIGESWELSDRNEAQSEIDGGEFAGRKIGELLESHGNAIYGRLAQLATRRFPLLIKYIDAQTPLSVQVHPDDAGAARYNDRGKSECWVVIHAEPGAEIIRGLKRGVGREEYKRAVAENRVESVLHSFAPKAGDVLALPAGMVHAIGAGLVVAEVQQNSDVTFRIYDYNRVGLDGKPRRLHVEEALEAIRFDEPRADFDGDLRADTVTPKLEIDTPGIRYEHLLSGKFFDLKRLTISEGCPAALNSTNAPRVLMTISGSGKINGRNLPLGQSVLIPADCNTVALEAAGAGLTVLLSEPMPAAF